MQRTTQQLPETCPNCAQPRAGITEGVAIYRCGSMTRHNQTAQEVETKAGPNCRRVVARLTFRLVTRA